jgi:hypothetical protein
MGMQRETRGSITVLRLRSEYFGGKETDRVRKAILDEAASGDTRLLLGPSEWSNMNSSALSVMLETQRI